MPLDLTPQPGGRDKAALGKIARHEQEELGRKAVLDLPFRHRDVGAIGPRRDGVEAVERRNDFARCFEMLHAASIVRKVQTIKSGLPGLRCMPDRLTLMLCISVIYCNKAVH